MVRFPPFFFIFFFSGHHSSQGWPFINLSPCRHCWHLLDSATRKTHCAQMPVCQTTTIHNKLRKIDINVHRYTSLKRWHSEKVFIFVALVPHGYSYIHILYSLDKEDDLMGLRKKYILILAKDFKVWRFWNVFEYMVYITLYMYMFVSGSSCYSFHLIWFFLFVNEVGAWMERIAWMVLNRMEKNVELKKKKKKKKNNVAGR